jgi:acetolactate synthase-1/2/3 large subunit
VLLNVAADASRATATEAAIHEPPRVLPVALGDAAAADARKMLAAAKRPLALLGRGAILGEAPAALRGFVEAWRLPFLATYKAKGAVDERHPLCQGALGLSPIVDTEVLRLVREADLLVLVGFDPIELRDAWLDAWPAATPCLSIDWAVATHRVFPVGYQAIGAVPEILRQLAPPATPGSIWPNQRLDAFRAAIAGIVRPRQPEHGISPAALFAEVSEQATADWLMTVDVGAHRILANHVVQCRTPGQLLQSNGLGCMGYALPAAIGAQLVRPEAPVVAMIGDGCMLMTQGELALAAERDLPLVIVVLNDGALSLIKLKQAKMQLAPRAVDFRSPRFDRIAEGFGARGVHVETIGEFAAALREAVASRRLTVIDAVVDPAEYSEQM